MLVSHKPAVATPAGGYFFARTPDNMKRIPLLGGGYAVVDDEDEALVGADGWRKMESKPGFFYAVSCRGPHRQALMHRVILKASAGQVVDHVNHSGLDNRRSNLRICSNSQNMANQFKRAGVSSRFKGVSARPRSSGTMWKAAIEHDGQTIHLGTFSEEERAARQYDRAARLLFGEFSLTNEKMGLLERRP